MRRKINKSVARSLLWDNAIYVMSVVCSSMNLNNPDDNSSDCDDEDIDNIILALEWWLGQLVYLKHGRKHEAKQLLKEIIEAAEIAFDRQPDLFMSCEKRKSKKNSNNQIKTNNNGKECKS